MTRAKTDGASLLPWLEFWFLALVVMTGILFLVFPALQTSGFRTLGASIDGACLFAAFTVWAWLH